MGPRPGRPWRTQALSRHAGSLTELRLQWGSHGPKTVENTEWDGVDQQFDGVALTSMGPRPEDRGENP